MKVSNVNCMKWESEHIRRNSRSVSLNRKLSLKQKSFLLKPISILQLITLSEFSLQGHFSIFWALPTHTNPISLHSPSWMLPSSHCYTLGNTGLTPFCFCRYIVSIWDIHIPSLFLDNSYSSFRSLLRCPLLLQFVSVDLRAVLFQLVENPRAFSMCHCFLPSKIQNWISCHLGLTAP